MSGVLSASGRRMCVLTIVEQTLSINLMNFVVYHSGSEIDVQNYPIVFGVIMIIRGNYEQARVLS